MACPKQHHSELEVFQNLLGIHFLAPGGGPNPDASRQIKPTNPLFDIFMLSNAASKRFRNRGLYDCARTHSGFAQPVHAHYSALHGNPPLLSPNRNCSDLHRSLRRQNLLQDNLTALGAINTVIAGMTAWLTGQNMPFRFRRARNQYREVVKAIESTERMFASGLKADPIKERDRLEQMYEEARLDQEANYPETQHEPATERHAKKNADSRAKMEKKKAEKKKEREEMRRELERFRHRAGGAAV